MSFSKQCARAKWLRLRGGEELITRLASRFDVSRRAARRTIAKAAPCRRCERLAWLVACAEPVTTADLAAQFGVCRRTARRWLVTWEHEGVASAVGFRWSARGRPALCQNRQDNA